jgi:hypothetical protein
LPRYQDKFMLTCRCIAVALLGGLVLGLPLVWLGRGRKPLAESDWLLAPFLGLSAALLVLHNLIYLDVPVAPATPWVWGGATLLWLGLLLTRGVRPLWRHCPWPVLLVMAGVYAVQGLGLLALGAEAYLGRAGGDQYNYTTVAQLLSDLPFSLSWDGIGQRPYLVDALVLKDDRIGVMLLQGFLACSVGAEAKHLFEATILLGPALVVPAVFALAVKLRFTPRRALVVAAVAGLLPGLTLLHLGSFLAHAVAVPFLLMLLVAWHDAATAPGPRSVLIGGTLLAATTALYTELAPVLLALTALFCVGGVVVCGLRPLRGVALLLGLLALLVGLNPLYAATAVGVCRRLTVTTVEQIANGFDWTSGFTKVWAHDANLHEQPLKEKAFLAAALGLTLLAVLGLLRLAWPALAGGWRGRADRGQREWSLLVVGVVVLALLPVPVLASVGRHPYQFVKLLLTVGPLLVVGLAALGQHPLGPAATGGPATGGTTPRSWLRWMAGWPLLGGVGLLALSGTCSMVSRTHYYRAGTHTEFRKLLAPEHREAVRVLGRMHDQPLVLACGPGLIDNCWFAYAARRNPVWLVSPVLNYGLVVGCDTGAVEGQLPLPVARHLIDLKAVPPGALVLTQEPNEQVAFDGEHRLVWANARYQLWRLGPGPCGLRPLPAALRP